MHSVSGIPLYLSIAVALGCFVAACDDSGTVRDAVPLSDAHRVMVGVDPEMPPYSFLDEDGSLRGMVVDLVQEMAAVLDLELAFRTAPPAELRRALREGEIDVIPHWPQTAEPPHGVLVSLPHSDISDSIFVRESGGPRSLVGSFLVDWLLENQAVVQGEDPAYEFASQRLTDRQILTESSPAAALRRLAGGDGDYALLPSRTGILLVRSLGLENLHVLPVNLDSYTRSLCFAVHDDDDELLAEFERGMVILTENGTYLRIYNEWEQFSSEDGPDLRWLVAVAGGSLFLLGLSTVWSWSLRRTVARRTVALRTEEAQRRRLEAQIQEARKLESLGILAGGVAHDFNNLLMGILGNASLARHSERGSDLEQRLAEIERAGRQAAGLTKQMLAYSGKGSFRFVRLDLSNLIRDLEDWISAHVAETTFLTLELAADLPKVEGDRDQLRQLLQNLLANASEALEGERGAIRLATSSRYCDAALLAETYLHPRLPAGTYVLLEVADDGVGMKREVLDRVFDPFFSTKFTGRGLGLAASLGIVRGHRGAIRIESKPGSGTRVRVYLPAVDDVPQGAADSSHDAAADDSIDERPPDTG
ncbi:MAG: transporter substrate-binding domain-containing protein [Thermoanaerobaculia bacterium]|nr:transporter substrate-binding domain-containing protein [Thermoanaerobaculia bacterium]